MQNALASLSKEDLILQNEEQRQHILYLTHQLAQLQKMIFGSKSERFVPEVQPNQLTLDLGMEPTPPAEKTTETITYTREKSKRKEKPVRQGIPSHIPRIEIILPRPAGTEGWKVIGTDITEELEYQPAKIFAKKYVRERLVNPCNEDDGVKIAGLPSRIIPKGIAGPGLLAHIILSKYADHLPVYRQIEMFRRLGIVLNDSTVNDWMAQVHRQLDQLYLTLRKLLLQCGYLQGDDTGMLVLEKPLHAINKKTKKDFRKRMKGYLWGWLSPELKLIYFEYHPTRGAIAPEEFLKEYHGYLQTDGYAAYERFDKRSDITLTGCMTHARRYFTEALETDKARAEKALQLFQQLYAIERIAREQNMTPEQRHKFRQEQNALAVMEELKQWAKEEYTNVLPKTPIAEAMAYFLRRYQYLARYLDEGKLEIDNNLTENSIRPIALGRKNYLFAGSHQGAKRAAMFYSLLGCCKKMNLDPFQWLRDVLTRLPEHPVNQLEELLPHKWKQQVFNDAMPQFEAGVN